MQGWAAHLHGVLKTLNEKSRQQQLAAISVSLMATSIKHPLNIFLQLAWDTSNNLLLLAPQDIILETRSISFP